jgi:predicted alpha/beta superfamily hydrolase
MSTKWIMYEEHIGERAHSVTGELWVYPNLASPQLNNQRDLLVWVPPNYQESHHRYPVIYMHDGQNLFDQATSYVGEWYVDEILTLLAPTGMEAIVVGIPNQGEQRMAEYGALDPEGSADAYLAFIVETVKPLVDQQFRTLPHRDDTGICGSSMGGLISLYGFFKHPETFGLVAAMSPSLWFCDQAMFSYVEQQKIREGRVYLDVGSNEGRRIGRGPVRSMVRDARRMRDLLISKGYRPGIGLRYVEEKGAHHHEDAWARRFPGVVEFLLKGE